MSTQTSPSSLLSDPNPRHHIVYPYNDEEKANNALYLFVSSGLSKGQAVVLIIADARCEPIIGKLAKAGLDVTALQDTGQLESISAESLLKALMAGGTLDERLLKDTVNSILNRAKTNSPSGKVRVFGEMVSFLLTQNNVSTAERLEEIWNQIIQLQSISVLCTYKLLGSGFNTLPESLALMHTHTLPE